VRLEQERKALFVESALGGAEARHEGSPPYCRAQHKGGLERVLEPLVAELETSATSGGEPRGSRKR
jgi:hypothetical protein